MTAPHPNLWSDTKHAIRGGLMGGADIIPGVSGGTVALILGIYQRLVTAVSHFDLSLIGFLRQRQWARAAGHCDLRFLVALGIGIVLGARTMAGLIHFLLEEHRQYTLAVFFGLILVSTLLVARMAKVSAGRHAVLCGALGIVACAAAFWLVGHDPFPQGKSSYAYLFVCSMVAICAMILPGISGAYILLILGNYARVTGAIHEVGSLRLTVENVTTLLVFATGCTVGLISFSKLLRVVLARHYVVTMSVLCGLMAGSLRKIWPFQRILHSDQGVSEHPQYENYLPTTIDGDVVLTALLTLAAVFGVLVFDYCARRFSTPS